MNTLRTIIREYDLVREEHRAACAAYRELLAQGYRPVIYVNPFGCWTDSVARPGPLGEAHRRRKRAWDNRRAVLARLQDAERSRAARKEKP